MVLNLLINLQSQDFYDDINRLVAPVAPVFPCGDSYVINQRISTVEASILQVI